MGYKIVKSHSVGIQIQSEGRYSDYLHCKDCGHIDFEFIGTKPLAGYLFDGYKCLHCGSFTAIDRNEILNQKQTHAIYNNSNQFKTITTR